MRFLRVTHPDLCCPVARLLIAGVFAIAMASPASAWPTPVRTDETGMLRANSCGFEVRVSPHLIAEPELCLRVLAKLRTDLRGVERVIPEHVLGLLRERTIIWIEKQGAAVPGGMSGRGMVFHPSAIWLRTNGLDPARAGGSRSCGPRISWHGPTHSP